MFGRLEAAQRLRGRNHETFVDGLTELLADLDALHPFREGNGRTRRAFCNQLTREAGHHLRWGDGPRENIEASHASLAGDDRPCAPCSSGWSTVPIHPPPRPSHGRSI